MNFDDIKWAVRELATAFRHRPGCDCAAHNRLPYVPRNAQPGASGPDEPVDTVEPPSSRP